MSKTLAVAARELRERWLLLPGGFVLGFVPLALPAFGIPGDGVPLVGLLLSILLAAVAAVVAGSSMLARDAADGRLGFLFSRPVAWPAIWGGKWLAAIVLVAASGALAAVPWMAVYPPRPPGGSWGAALLDAQSSAFLVLLLVVAIGLANFNATAIRSRAPWLAVDLALLLVALGAIRYQVAPLLYLGVFGGDPLGRWRLHVSLVPLALGLLLGSAVQVAVGRTDLRRAHRAMSTAFWAVVFAAIGTGGVRLAWARAADPTDVTVSWASHDPSGRWLYVVGGSRRGGAPAFLVDAVAGRYVSLGLERVWAPSRSVAFSADGRWGAALRADDDGAVLARFDLAADPPRRSEIPLESSPPPTWSTTFALSPSGAAVLVAHESGASVFALPSGRRVATSTLPPGWRPAALCFTGEGTARVWASESRDRQAGPAPAEMRVIDLAVGGAIRKASFTLAVALDPVRGWPRTVVPDEDGTRLLTFDGGVRLRDGASGTLVATLVEAPAPVAATFVADGRVVTAEPAGTLTLLRVFSPDGAPLHQVTLDRQPLRPGVGPELAPGRVAVHFDPPFRAGETLVFDLDAGRVAETLPGLQPAPGFCPLAPPLAAGGEVPTVHFFVEAGRMVRLDFATGERRVVAGPGAPRGERISIR